MTRIAIIPLLIGFIWIGSPGFRWAALAVYSFACLTDYLDGYLARYLNHQTAMGRLFDPIADKLLVGACLLELCAFDYITGWTVLSCTGYSAKGNLGVRSTRVFSRNKSWLASQ